MNEDVTEVPEGLSITVDGEDLDLDAKVVNGKVEITVPEVEAPEEGVTEVTYAVTLDDVTEEVTLKVTAMGKIELIINEVEAVDADNILVTFEGVEEPVTIELEESLTHGENEVTFTYEDVEYTATVDYVDAEEAAKEAVEALFVDYDKQEELAEEDPKAAKAVIADAKEAVEALEDGDVKTGLLADVEKAEGLLPAAVATDFAKVTTDVLATTKDENDEEVTETKIHVSAVDQYGEEVDLSKHDLDNDKVTATVNGMPVTATYDKGVVTVDNKLNKEDELVVTITANETDSVLEYTVLERKDNEPVISTVELKAGEESLEFGKDTTVTFTARDQYNNPMTDTLDKNNVNWFVDGKPVDGNGSTLTFDKAVYEEQGSFDVQAFYAEDTKLNDKVTIVVGEAELTELNFNSESTTGLNHEEEVLGTVTANEGAALTPEMVKFDVKAGEDLTAEDIEVKAALRHEVVKDVKADDENGKDVVVVATTSKAGKYDITVSVDGEEEAIEAKQKATVTTTVNQTVTDIVLGDLGDQVLTNGGEVEVDVTLTNKHGENVVPEESEFEGKDPDYKVVSSNTTFATGELSNKDVKDENGKKTGDKVVLTITGEADEGKATLHIVKGKVESNRLEVEANEASKAAKVEAVEEIEVIEDANEASLHKVVVKDQYGREMKPADVEKLNKAITFEEVEVEDKDGKKITKLNETASFDLVEYYTDDNDEIQEVASEETPEGLALKLKVADDAEVKNGDKVTVKATVAGEKDGDDPVEIGSLTVNLKEAAKLDKATVEAKATKLTTGATTTVLVKPVDQYGEIVADLESKITITANDVISETGSSSDATPMYENKDGKLVESEQKEDDSKLAG